MPRKATPASLHLVMGNPNNKTKKEVYGRLKAEKQLTVGHDAIDAPDWLTATARRNFYRIRDVLIETNLITDADVDLITNYAISVSDLQDIEMKINATQRYIKTEKEGIKVSALMKEKRNIMAQMLKLQSELALTPRARASMAIAITKDGKEQEEDDEFDHG